MYDKKIKELEENLDEVENLLELTTEVIDKMSEEIADLKETNARLIREIESLADDIPSSELLASAVREIQDEMKKVDRKLILIHEV
jgi:DNA repair ATPase RecN|tara:strand:+ start:181 stop:438 length:258 start_codon:yes stop_codon:yes gene_type:complete